MPKKKDDLKDLPPEERIKILKKLEKEKKKEIAEAQEEIKKSHDELTERRKWVDKVPIPEFAQEDTAGLSAEGKKILEQRGIKERLQVEKDKVPARKEKIDLEDTVAKEQVELPPEAMADVQYGRAMEGAAMTAYKVHSEKPMEYLAERAETVREAVREQGYMSTEQQKEIDYLVGVTEERTESGTYSFTEETAKAASLIQSIGADVRAYKSKSSGSNPNYHA